MAKIEPHRLYDLFTLDKDTGRLFWRPLPIEMFRGGALPPETRRTRWLKEHVGKEAFVHGHRAGYVALTRQGSKTERRMKQELILGRKYQAHHVVWAMVHGHWPTGDIIHKNGDKTDNTPSNLEAWPRGKKNNRYQKLSSPDSPPSPFTKPKSKHPETDTSTTTSVTTSQKPSPSRALRPDISSGPIARTLFYRLFDHDPAAGKLYWRERTPDMYPEGTASPTREAKRFNSRWAGTEAFTSLDGKGYAKSTVMGHTLYAHHIIWVMIYGEWPRHRLEYCNGDRTDHRLGNLREKPTQSCEPVTSSTHHSITLTEATRPVPSLHPLHPYRGVYWSARKGAWAAIDRTGDVPRMIGLFDGATDAREAVRRVDRAAAGTDKGYDHDHPGLSIPPLCPVRGWTGVMARDPCHPAISEDYPAGQFFARTRYRGRTKYFGPFDTARKARAAYHSAP